MPEKDVKTIPVLQNFTYQVSNELDILITDMHISLSMTKKTWLNSSVVSICDSLSLGEKVNKITLMFIFETV